MEQKKLNVGLVTTVSGRWPRELPNQRNIEYSKWLSDNFYNINLVKNKNVAANNSDIANITDEFKKEAIDLVIIIIGAFTGDYAATYLADELKIPIILWAPNEPPFDGKRLMANSLVAATMNAAALNRLGHKYHFVYGDYTKKRVQDEIKKIIIVYNTIKKLKYTFLGLLGYRPTGFYSSIFDETLIRKVFGIKMEAMDLKVLFDMADAISLEDVIKDSKKLSSELKTKELPEGYLLNHSRVYLAIKQIIKEQGFNALTLKCWPEMGNLKSTPCAVISRFADKGYIIGCESDMDMTITMLIQKYLTDKIVFMADLINIDEDENSALFWHCGQASRCLKDPDSDIYMSDHPLAGQGVALETTLKSGIVTIAQISKIKDNYRLFIVRGNAIPTKKVIKGVMVNVILEEPVLKTIYKIADEGIPHHYSIVWDDAVDEMKFLGKVLNLEIIEI